MILAIQACVGWDLPRVFREWYGMIPGMVRNDSGNGTELFREWYGMIPGLVQYGIWMRLG